MLHTIQSTHIWRETSSSSTQGIQHLLRLTLFREAIRNSVPFNYASLMCIFALSSVMGREIYSLYPEEIEKESKHSKLNNGVIKPRVVNSKLSTSFNMNFIPAIPGDFQPNQSVPIINAPPATTPHTGYSRKFTTDKGTVANNEKITNFLKVKPR